MSLINNDRRLAAETLHDYVLKGAYVSALSLKLIFDNHLYRELGYETQKEYIEGCLPFGETTAYKYLKVASTFGMVLGISFNYDELDRSFSSTALAKLSPMTVDENANDIWNLGLVKLYMISLKVQPWQIHRLVKEGYLELSKDFMLTKNEIFEMSVRELSEWFAEAERKIPTTEQLLDPNYGRKKAEKPAWVPVSKEVLKTAKYLKAKLETFASYTKPEIARAAGYEPNARLTEFNLELEDITNTLDSLLERLQFINQEVAS